MTLNKTQKTIIYVWLLLFSICLIFPPYSADINIYVPPGGGRVFGDSITVNEFIGYNFIFHIHKHTFNIRNFQIDIIRLFLQWIALTVIMLTLVTLNNNKKREVDDKTN